MPETVHEQTEATAPAEHWRPAFREIVIDNHSQKPAECMGREDDVWWLRPVGGGIEWPAESVRQATSDEVLQAKLSVRNRMSDLHRVSGT